ncbi:MAG: sugar ABC transporter ATP-binding protein [Protaetiibacter sp.]
MSASVAPVLAAENITKTFPGVVALDGVSIELMPGEVHALIGENGAGKSTLISILSGSDRANGGRLLLHGEEVAFESPAAARRQGIATIFQELAIEPWLNVSANVVLGNEPGRGPFLSRRQADEVARRQLARLGADDIPLHALAGQLSTAQKQLIEIARALAVDPSVIIMDEPTSSLPARDVERLLDIVRQLRAEGTAIVFVSHRLDEIRSIADRVTVLREGRKVATEPADGLSTDRMIELMTGRSIGSLFPERNSRIGDIVLEADGLSRAGAFDDVSFTVRAGEILGFAGLIGAGRPETMRALYGADPLDAGRITLRGEPFEPKNVRASIAAGIAYLPEDRKEQGLVLGLPVSNNMVLSTLKRFSRLGMVSGRRIRETATRMSSTLRLRGRVEGAVANLSGGNQQKVIIAKALISEATVLIFDEPTRGVDVGAKLEVYTLMQELAAQGAAVILVSSELPEVMNVAHRIVVMSAGRVSGHYAWPDFDERTILSDAFAAFAS